MVHETGIASKVALACSMGAMVTLVAPVMVTRAWAADDNPVASLKGGQGCL